MLRIALIALLLISSGCAESYFRLSEESRLPYWFEIPEGETRQQYTVALTYYAWPSGREAVLKLEKKDGWFGGKKIDAKLDGDKPISLRENIDGNPEYEIARQGGITDVIEHRGMNDIFYMSDDTKVWEELGLTRP